MWTTTHIMLTVAWFARYVQKPFMVAFSKPSFCQFWQLISAKFGYFKSCNIVLPNLAIIKYYLSQIWQKSVNSNLVNFDNLNIVNCSENFTKLLQKLQNHKLPKLAVFQFVTFSMLQKLKLCTAKFGKNYAPILAN